MPLRVRPGTAADIAAAARVYHAAFGTTSVVELMHPKRHEYPSDVALAIYRLLHARYWGDEEQIFLVVVDSSAVNTEEEVIGFAWFRRPWLCPARRAAHEGWLTLRGWLKPFLNTYRRAGEYLYPVRSADPDMADVFNDMHDKLERRLDGEDPNPPRRRQAWYLSTLGVVPAAQGKGVGGLLVREALSGIIDPEGAACWLVGIRGVEPFYSRFGFVQIGRANEGRLADWDGGAIMMRE